MQSGLNSEIQARYAAMQAVSGSTFLAALLCAAASHYFFSPGIVFAGGSLLAGAFIFFAWLFATKKKTALAAVFALLAVATFLGSVTLELRSSLPYLLATGLSRSALSLFGLVGLVKWHQGSRLP